MTQKDLLYLAGSLCSLLVALAGVADQLPSHWRAPLTVAGVLGATVGSWLARSPHDV